MQKHKRIYIEIALALIVVAGFGLLYRYEETNFETYLANHFPSQGLSLGQVVSVQNETGGPYLSQNIVVQFFTGGMKGETTTVVSQSASSSTSNNYFQISQGETVLLARDNLSGYAGTPYYIVDRYRLPALFFAILLFMVVAVLFGRIRGLTSLIGLAMSVAVLMGFIVPQILVGHDPLTVCLIGAAAIALVSFTSRMGSINGPRSPCAARSLRSPSLRFSRPFSFPWRSSSALQPIRRSIWNSGTNINLNLRGLLLGGIVIGALGVLDDVTIGQSVTVYELKDANPSLGIKELYRRAMSIGREHIASLINTLFLAYAGVSLPIILYLVAFQSGVPLMVRAERRADCGRDRAYYGWEHRHHPRRADHDVPRRLDIWKILNAEKKLN